jgi:catechol 2,3-dioxygenase-like lactoylglutathione lyase family enzyme
MAKVTGVGGVFFRVADPAATVAWYREHLGIEPEADYPCATLRWSGGETTVWAPFDTDTDYFGPSGQELMVNYRVDDVDGLLVSLRAAGVETSGEVLDSENGRFAWAVDLDGRRFELWQPPVGE